MARPSMVAISGMGMGMGMGMGRPRHPHHHPHPPPHRHPHPHPHPHPCPPPHPRHRYISSSFVLFLLFLSPLIILLLLSPNFIIPVQCTDYLDFEAFDPSMTLDFSGISPFTPTLMTDTGLSTLPRTILFKPALYSNNIISPTGASSETRRVVVANPITACSRLISPPNTTDYYKDAIVLVAENACRFAPKGYNVQNAGGFLTVIFVNRPVAGGFSGVRYELKESYNTSNPLLVPTVTINWAPGYAISESLRVSPPNATISLTVPTTGPMLPSELSTLRTIFRGWTSPPSTLIQDSTLLTGASQQLVSFLYDNQTDPCLQRVIRTWCIGGQLYNLNLNGLGISGNFTPEWGKLTQLTYLSLAYNKNFAGPMPCEWGDMASLRAISIGQTGLTSLTPCIAKWTLMEQALMGFNPKLTNLPPEVSEWTNIKVISVDTCNISQPMVNISKWTQLTFFDFNSNRFTGSLPSFRHCLGLQKMYFTNNLLSGPVAANSFDFLPNLINVDFSRNQLTGKLPNFFQFSTFPTTLVNLAFERNQFNGSLPFRWNFPSLQSLRGGYNMLSGDLFGTFRSMQNLIYCDLSHNLFQLPEYFEDVGLYFALTFPSKIQQLHMSHNRLSGPFLNKLGKQVNLTHLIVSHNDLTALPSQLFLLNTESLESKVTHLDFSFNPRLTGYLSPIGPTQTLEVLKLDGCPLLHDTNIPAQLPSYIITSTDATYTKASLDQRYDCPGLTGRDYPLIVQIDPAYYDYDGCICEQGTYGTPPNCMTIPISIRDTPINASGIITDAPFGSSRMSLGIDTAWLIGMNPDIETRVVTNVTTYVNVTHPVTLSTNSSNITSSSSNDTFIETYETIANITQNVTIIRTPQNSRVRAIYISFQLSETDFQQFDDIIDIYEGGVDLKGLRVVSFRGSDPRPLKSNYPDVVAGYPSNTFVVFASSATINFRSRATSGTHFTANYTLSEDCPPGWAHHGDRDRCLPIYRVSSTVQILVYAVSAVILTLILITIAFVFYHRNTVIFRASSVPFCFSILIFAAIMSTGAILYALPADHSIFICNARIWLTCFSLIGLLASLLVKANRIRDIFTNQDLNKPAATNSQLARTIAIMLAVETGLLIAVTVTSMSHAELMIGVKATEGYQVWECTSVESQSYVVWLTVQVVYVGVFLSAGLYIAFGVRHVPTAFNESSHIVNSLYLLTILAILLLPINFIVDDNPAALALIRGVGQNLVALSMTLAIFGSKFYYIFDGRGNDASIIRTASARPPSPGDKLRRNRSHTPESQFETGDVPKSQQTLQAIVELLHQGGETMHLLQQIKTITGVYQEKISPKKVSSHTLTNRERVAQMEVAMPSPTAINPILAFENDPASAPTQQESPSPSTTRHVYPNASPQSSLISRVQTPAIELVQVAPVAQVQPSRNHTSSHDPSSHPSQIPSHASHAPSQDTRLRFVTVTTGSGSAGAFDTNSLPHPLNINTTPIINTSDPVITLHPHIDHPSHVMNVTDTTGDSEVDVDDYATPQDVFASMSTLFRTSSIQTVRSVNIIDSSTTRSTSTTRSQKEGIYNATPTLQSSISPRSVSTIQREVG